MILRRPTSSAAQAIKSRLSTKDFWSIHLLWMAIFTYATSSLVLDSIRLNNFSTAWIWIAIATFVEALGLALLVKHATPKSVWKTRCASWYTAITVAIIGGIKNLTVALIADYLGLEKGIDFLPRFIGGMGLGLAIALATVVFFGARLDHEATMKELSSARKQLEAYQKNSRTYLQQQTRAMVEDTQKIINPRLQEIELLIKSEDSIENGIAEIRKLIAQGSDLINNRLLLRADAMSSFVSEPAPTGRLFRYRKLMVFQLSPNLHPRNLWIIFVLWQQAIVYVTLGFEHLLAALISAVPVMIALHLLKFTTSFVKSKSPIVNFAIIISFSLVFAPVSLILLWPQIQNEMIQMLLLGYSFVDLLITLIGAMFLNVINADRQLLEKQAEVINEKLRRQIKKFDQEIWLNRRRWSYLLHGRVQSLLTIAINRLSGNSKQTPETIHMVLRDFEQIRKAISSPPATEIDLAAELKLLRDTWRGVCEVKVQIDRFSSKLLELDSDARMAVNEISKEVVSNAYRHGKASQVAIRISKQSDQEILLSAINNGHPLMSQKNRQRRGIGSQMLDDIALDWSIKSDRIAQKTEFRATIAIESNSAY